MTRTLARRLLFACATWLWASCAAPPPEAEPMPSADRMRFDNEIQPLLLRDCGFTACHGSSARFFQVFGPGHGRLSPDTRSVDPITADELTHSFTRALSMFDPTDRERSPLLRKPLALAAGGTGHEGTDLLGRNVYQSKDDPSYRLLHAWVTQGAPP